MNSRVLVASRATKRFEDWEDDFEGAGFTETRFTCRDRDGLIALIREYNPGLLVIGSGFYKSATPYMTGRLLDIFPKLNVAAVSAGEYPDDLAMYFIVNGARSYVTMNDGRREFRKA